MNPTITQQPHKTPLDILSMRQLILREFNPSPGGWNLYTAAKQHPQQRHSKRPSPLRHFSEEELLLINLKRLAGQQKGIEL